MDDYNILIIGTGTRKHLKVNLKDFQMMMLLKFLKQELLEKRKRRKERKKEKNKRLSKQRKTRSIKNIVPRWNYYLSG